MKNNIKVTVNISGFEPISETSENKLIGGFSASLSTNDESLQSLSNNCHGGNCVKGCGGWPSNDWCNSVPGCGVIE